MAHSLNGPLDSDFFRGSKNQVHSDTQLKWLRADTGEPNADAMAAAADQATACPETATHHKQRQPEPVLSRALAVTRALIAPGLGENRDDVVGKTDRRRRRRFSPEPGPRENEPHRKERTQNKAGT